MCTISLGSHAVFNYYRYTDGIIGTGANEVGISAAASESSSRSPEQGARMIEANGGKENGRSIAPQPVASVLLEPRSLIITRSSLYTEHLHGIEPISEDIFTPVSSSSLSPNSDAMSDGGYVDSGFGVSEPSSSTLNWKLLGDRNMRDVVGNGGRIRRETRVSLTCRDVERVLQVSKVQRR